MSAHTQFSQELAGRVAVIRQEITAATGQIDRLQERLSVLWSSLADAEAAARVLTVPLPAPLSVTATTGRAVGKGAFQAQVLAALTAAYLKSLRASDIAREAQARLGLAVHPKTTGMVLNRLKHAGRAERDGRTWRLVPVPVLP